MSKRYENAIRLINHVAEQIPYLPLTKRVAVTAFHLQNEQGILVTSETLDLVKNQIQKLDPGAMTDDEYAYLMLFDMFLRFAGRIYGINYVQGSINWCGCRPAIVFECRMKGRAHKVFEQLASEILQNPTVKFYKRDGKSVVIFGVPRDQFSPVNITEFYHLLVNKQKIKPLPLKHCRNVMP
jgi:hypothetical protein